jgi:pimeloyl-ACP methyl ester carboxylesterase
MAVDVNAFTTHFASPRGFPQAYIHERSRTGQPGPAVVCVHGWPETKRVFWKVITPLAEAGCDVIVPDLRGFGESAIGPDGFHDVVSHAYDLYALIHDHLGYDSVVVVGGDLGGPVIQELALRYPSWVKRMVLFNSPLPYNKERMAGM